MSSLWLSLESTNGVLTVKSLLPVRRKDLAAAHWCIAVVLIPSMGLLFYTLVATVLFEYLLEFEFVAGWSVARIPFTLGVSALYFLLFGAVGRIVHDSPQPRGLLMVAGLFVLAALLVFAEMVAGLSGPSWIVWYAPLLGIFVPISWALRRWCIDRLAGPVLPPAPWEWPEVFRPLPLFRPDRFLRALLREVGVMSVIQALIFIAVVPLLRPSIVIDHGLWYYFQYFMIALMPAVVMGSFVVPALKIGPSLRALRVLPQSRAHLAGRIVIAHLYHLPTLFLVALLIQWSTEWAFPFFTLVPILAAFELAHFFAAARYGKDGISVVVFALLLVFISMLALRGSNALVLWVGLLGVFGCIATVAFSWAIYQELGTDSKPYATRTWPHTLSRQA